MGQDAETFAYSELHEQRAPAVVVAPAWVDPITGATYVHKDLQQAREHWAAEWHLGPINRTEKFGDVESWAEYVTVYTREPSEEGGPSPRTDILLTWNERGLHAVLDYISRDGTSDHFTWQASHPFEVSPQWMLWRRLTDGRPRSQREVIEALEDLSEDIVDPPPADLAGILRKLRATSMATAETKLLRPDGSSTVLFKKDNRVQAGELTIPAEFRIAVPVLRGHTEVGEDGKQVPVRYSLAVRLRVGVGDDARLSFRLSMPGADRALEAVFADRVERARALLGDGYVLLRAAGGS